jgi:hypothetical protein
MGFFSGRVKVWLLIISSSFSQTFRVPNLCRTGTEGDDDAADADEDTEETGDDEADAEASEEPNLEDAVEGLMSESVKDEAGGAFDLELLK